MPTRANAVKQNPTAIAAAAAAAHLTATSLPTEPLQYTKNKKTMMNTSLLPILALAAPVYRKRVKSTRKKMKTVPVLHPASDECEEAIDAAPPTSHAGIRRRRPELLFSRYWNTSVDSMERAADKRKMKRVTVLSPATDEEGDDSICKIGFRRRGSELPFLGKGSKSVDMMERGVAVKRVGAKRKRKTGSVLSPLSNEEGEEEIHAVPICNSCSKRGRSEVLFSQKGENGGGDSMEWAENKIRVKSKRKTKTVTDGIPVFSISIRRRRSELPRLRKRIWSVDWMVTAVAEMEGENKDRARSICTSHKEKKAFATASLPSQECREATESGRKSWIPAPALKKMTWTPPAALGFAEVMDGERGEALGISQQIPTANIAIEKNIITGRAKKKLKKNNEIVKMMIGEDNTKEAENPSCSNGGISRQSLESFANMVKAFRYTGNRSLLDPLGCVESDVASTSANVAFSMTFKGEKASCNGTKVTNGTLEETENRSNLQQPLRTLNIPETTPHIATTSFTTLNHNKRITTFGNSNTVVAVNPSLVSGQQDEAPWVLPASVSKKMKRQHKEAPVHAPCPALAHEPASQKTKKQRKIASSPTTDEVDKVRKSVRCKHRETMTKAEKMQDSYRRVSPDNNWVPPNSPYELLQEDHAFDPWRVLVICMLLNQTTGEQVKKILRRVFLLCPTAEAAIQVPMNELRTIIESLGLQNKRVRDIREMSRQYLKDGWTYVTELHGVGKDIFGTQITYKNAITIKFKGEQICHLVGD